MTGRNGASSMAAAVATSKISIPLGRTAATGRPGPAPRSGQDRGQAEGPLFQLTIGAHRVAGDDGGTIRTFPGVVRHPPHRTRGTFCHRRRDYCPRRRGCPGRGLGAGERRREHAGSDRTRQGSAAGRPGSPVRGDRPWLMWLRPPAHPLDALDADEIRAAVAAVRDSGRVGDGVLFSTVTLDEPSRTAVATHRPGDPVERRVRLTLLPGPEADVIEAVVALGPGRDHRVDARAPGCDRRSCSTTPTGPSWPSGQTRIGRRPCCGGASPTSRRSRSTPGRPATSATR